MSRELMLIIRPGVDEALQHGIIDLIAREPVDGLWKVWLGFKDGRHYIQVQHRNQPMSARRFFDLNDYDAVRRALRQWHGIE